MDHLDFFVTALRDGTVNGVGRGSTKEAMTAALGHDFVDDTDKRGRSGRCDYGLLEFGMDRRDGAWVVSGVSVQVYRLAQGDPPPAPVVQRYGRFPERTPAAALFAALERSGVPVRSHTHPADAPYQRFRVGGASDAELLVHYRDGDEDAGLGLRDGDLYSLTPRWTVTVG